MPVFRLSTRFWIGGNFYQLFSCCYFTEIIKKERLNSSSD